MSPVSPVSPVATGGHQCDRPTNEWWQNLRDKILVTESKYLACLQHTVSEKFPENLEGESYAPLSLRRVKDIWFFLSSI